MNDYIFSELGMDFDIIIFINIFNIGLDDTKINHPLVITECFANPEFFRSKILEQMFECYQIPSLIVGVDCMFSYHYNTVSQQDKSNDCKLIFYDNNILALFRLDNKYG